MGANQDWQIKNVRLVMKIFITADYEGVSGHVQWNSGGEREAITLDINAAVAGAFDGGAKEVLVGEAHGNMRNIIPEMLDPRANFLSGQPKPLNHVGGIDSTFNGAMLVAYHAKSGTLHGIMAHTYTGSVFSLKFNGIEVGAEGPIHRASQSSYIVDYRYSTLDIFSKFGIVAEAKKEQAVGVLVNFVREGDPAVRRRAAEPVAPQPLRARLDADVSAHDAHSEQPPEQVLLHVIGAALDAHDDVQPALFEFGL
jgi:hypothetical protein